MRYDREGQTDRELVRELVANVGWEEVLRLLAAAAEGWCETDRAAHLMETVAGQLAQAAEGARQAVEAEEDGPATDEERSYGPQGRGRS